MTSATAPRDLMRTSELADRYLVSLNTIANWVNNPAIGYPKPFKVNGRNYWRRAEIESWEAAQPAGQMGKEATAA